MMDRVTASSSLPGGPFPAAPLLIFYATWEVKSEALERSWALQQQRMQAPCRNWP